MAIDLNADAGESFGAWRMGDDERLLPQLTSVNLACGFHAGDPRTLLRSVQLAAEHGVAIGAHPGLPDLVGFGRRDLAIDAHDLYAIVVVQIGALIAALRAAGLGEPHHVKPHGALHHRTVRDDDAADALARAVAHTVPATPLVTLAGPAGERQRAAAARHGVRSVDEAFPDRGLLADGRLAPREAPGAILHEPDAIAERAVRIARDGALVAISGETVELRARTLCLHGDHPGAVSTAAAVRAALQAAGVEVATYR